MGTGIVEKREEKVAVAIDNDKASQYALKWTVDHLLTRGQALTLLHVNPKVSSLNNSTMSDENDELTGKYKRQLEDQARELFLPFRCFCTRKDIKCKEMIVEDVDISKTLINYVSSNSIEVLVLGAPSRSGFVRRFKTTDVPSSVTRGAPDFCTVYVISKGKVSSVRTATAPLPAKTTPPPPQNGIQQHAAHVPDPTDTNTMRQQIPRERQAFTPRRLQEEFEIKSPFSRNKGSTKTHKASMTDSELSFISSGRPSMDRLFPSLYDSIDSGSSSRLSNSSDWDYRSFESSYSGTTKSFDTTNSPLNFSLNSPDSGMSWSSADETEAEMRRLKLELKQTIDMYSTACKEALSAKYKANEIQPWKIEEEEIVAEDFAEKEIAKCKAATEAAEAANRIAESEAHKRMRVEFEKATREADAIKKAVEGFSSSDLRYRRYTIEEIEAATENFSDSLKVGEGGYGPVYRGELDLTPVAIKVLRPDAAQGRSQFLQEVEVLSCIRHPNMVLLLGACPEYGCLVYEYMANGSLEDCLFRQGNTPVLPWQLRFRIAAEIGTALLFLHSTKPEPLVHRDLKPGNILLDRNYVSKISDVGLARLVPPSVADSVTQYRMTSTAGTFCYIDPEYQQTGLLGIKSDVYSLGVMLLQIITAKPPMGLTHHVERAIEIGKFAEILDPDVHDWPVEEALKFAKLSLQCAEMRKKDRPDLGKAVLPELNRLRAFAEESMASLMFRYAATPRSIQVSKSQDIMSDPQLRQNGPGFDSFNTQFSNSSFLGRR